ncbi:uncharacterized protein EV420DRAFT_1485445 [Desarmillaria tabescens]|uniref:Uncharacterized protein n=1 Tax=Armillaria tabescens TaxID=1929756 RepID=A0AA39MQ00_ARMTA|nr:uncharacterized protein EV420DRAFT_1485445 [Desarmillaria tabescens]KAK0442008.1 hypothetical protein EV420DRAFT_1485445 [Desarmillaria tabescens]
MDYMSKESVHRTLLFCHWSMFNTHGLLKLLSCSLSLILFMREAAMKTVHLLCKNMLSLSIIPPHFDAQKHLLPWPTFTFFSDMGDLSREDAEKTFGVNIRMRIYAPVTCHVKDDVKEKIEHNTVGINGKKDTSCKSAVGRDDTNNEDKHRLSGGDIPPNNAAAVQEPELLDNSIQLNKTVLAADKHIKPEIINAVSLSINLCVYIYMKEDVGQCYILQ